MHAKIVGCLSVLLLSHGYSYAIVAYTPEAVRECISAIYHVTEKNNRKRELEELYAAIRENRMLTSEAVASEGVAGAIEIMRSSNVDYSQDIQYLEQYLNNLDTRGILLALEGDASHKTSWPMGLISRSMRDQQDAYNLLCLSNELSDNLMLCGCADMNAHSHALMQRANSMSDPSISFSPVDMTNSQTSTPSLIMGGTGVSSPIVTGWALTPSINPQSLVNMQFTLPGNLAKHKDVTLELALLVPSNLLPEGYAKFKVCSRYVRDNFDLNNIDWTSTNTSGNIKIEEASTPGNLKYITVQIPLSSHHLKANYFALLSVSRIAPTGSKPEYNGDVVLVSAVYRYTAQ
jgi:hypothetical protein